MAKESNKSNVLGDLVDGYNKMYADPLEYAKTTYASEIKSQGRRDPRDTGFVTQKKWDKNEIPG